MHPILLASRPKTLPAAIVPVWIGSVLAWYLTGQFSLALALCTVGATICIQVATNLFNDALDSRKGADTKKRQGPIRITAAGQLSEKSVMRIAFVFLVIAILFSLPLVFTRGWEILAIGIPSLYLCYGYTGGPWPLAYKGLGEAFVILFFGLVAVMGTVFVQIGEWRIEAALLGVIVGLLSCFLIAINNLRDVDEDRTTGKRTIAVILGKDFYKRLMFMMSGHTFVGVLAFWFWQKLPMGPEFGFLVLSCILLTKVLLSKGGKDLNKYLAMAGGLLILFAVIFHLSCWFIINKG